MDIDRRTFTALAAAAVLLPGRVVAAPAMTVYKGPSCGCCEAWVDHLKAAGYPTMVIETPAINAVKTRLGVTQALRSCHTAEVEGYVLEGHVPAAALARLLAERPAGRGLAVPGMPTGAPGMEVVGAAPATYDVLLFGDGEPIRFVRFTGAKPV